MTIPNGMKRYLHLSGVDISQAHHRASPGDWLDR
jgi:hypothetical protein